MSVSPRCAKTRDPARPPTLFTLPRYNVPPRSGQAETAAFVFRYASAGVRIHGNPRPSGRNRNRPRGHAADLRPPLTGAPSRGVGADLPDRNRQLRRNRQSQGSPPAATPHQARQPRPNSVPPPKPGIRPARPSRSTGTGALRRPWPVGPPGFALYWRRLAGSS